MCLYNIGLLATGSLSLPLHLDFSLNHTYKPKLKLHNVGQIIIKLIILIVNLVSPFLRNGNNITETLQMKSLP